MKSVHFSFGDRLFNHCTVCSLLLKIHFSSFFFCFTFSYVLHSLICFAVCFSFLLFYFFKVFFFLRCTLPLPKKVHQLHWHHIKFNLQTSIYISLLHRFTWGAYMYACVLCHVNETMCTYTRARRVWGREREGEWDRTSDRDRHPKKTITTAKQQ